MPEMVIIPSGSFVMGARELESVRMLRHERPQHLVKIKTFAMGKTPITQRQWFALMGTNPSHFTDHGDNRPVDQVNWLDAQAYVDKLSSLTGKPYRLPSEAEWEYAARAGGTAAYPWGQAISRQQAHYGHCDETVGTASVATYSPNAFGLHDMIGNIREWVQDSYYDSYDDAPIDGSARQKGDSIQHVLRGGCWADGEDDVRSASRIAGNTTEADFLYGFRVAMTLPTY